MEMDDRNFSERSAVAAVAAVGVLLASYFWSQADAKPETSPRLPSVAADTNSNSNSMDADTRWDDPFAPSPAVIQALANQLEQEIEE